MGFLPTGSKLRVYLAAAPVGAELAVSKPGESWIPNSAFS